MNTHLQDGNGTDDQIASEIASGMLRAVERNYARLFEAAKKQWERDYAGPDPSDACVSVRITTGEPRMLSSALNSEVVSLSLEASLTSTTF